MWVEIRAFIAGAVFASAVWGACVSRINANHVRWMAGQTEARALHMQKLAAGIRAQE